MTDYSDQDENNASAEAQRAQTIYDLGDDVPITADFLRNVPFSGRFEDLYGQLVGHTAVALAAIERRANMRGGD